MPLDLPAFRPHPLVRGGHLQTIVGSFLPSRVAINPILHHVPLPDGDAIALHDDGPPSIPIAGSKPAPGELQNSHPPEIPTALIPTLDLGPRTLDSLSNSTQNGRQSFPPTAILLHGLGGCHLSSYMLRCSAKLRARGVRVFRMDLRGCGAGMALARHPLHAGRSEDAAAVLEFVSQLCPGSRIHLIGFSMGANIVLKLAGELGAAAPPHLASVLAVSPPIDLMECTRNIQRGLNQLYDRRFVRSLIRHIRHRTTLVPEMLTRPLVPHPRRLTDFDTLFTAPLAGFANLDDYYARASSGSLLAHIAVPTLIITAASDPIVPVASFERATYSPTTQLIIAPCGGHLGYVAAKSSDPDLRWLDWRIVDWVVSHTAIGHPSPKREF